MNNTTITGADLPALYGKSIRTVQMTYKDVAGQPFDRNAQVSPDIIAQLDAKWLREKGATKTKAPRKSYAKAQSGAEAQQFVFSRNDAQVVAQQLAQVSPIVAPKIAPVVAPPAQEETSDAQISRNWRDVLSDIICIGVVLFHAWLIAYDCSQMWGVPGTIGGTLAFMVQGLALLYSTDPNKTRTSETAILVVFLIDLLAWFVHYPTFMDNATASASAIVTGVLCGVLCLFSFMASYLYRDSKII